MLIFTHESPIIVANMRNILENQGIEVQLKNEFTQGATGELSVFESWQEIWLINDKDKTKAEQIINACKHHANQADWFCSNCKEPNGAAFEICWNCQHPLD